MATTYQMLRPYLPSGDRLDRLLEIGWEDTGGMFLAIGAFAFMGLIGAVRAR